MTIARHESRMQVCCDHCPASYPEIYDHDDFSIMISDAKAAGWEICKTVPECRPTDAADLFGSRPIAGSGQPSAMAPGVRRSESKIVGFRPPAATSPHPYTHTCPACRETAKAKGRLI